MKNGERSDQGRQTAPRRWRSDRGRWRENELSTVGRSLTAVARAAKPNWLWIGALLTTGCGADGVAVSVEVTPGQETDAFRMDPAVVEFEIKGLGESGEGTVEVSARAAPGESFSLGEVAADAALRFEVTGRAENGDVLVRGRSLGVPIAAVSGSTIPIFAQRLGGWARPPGGILQAHTDAPVGVLANQFLLTTGGNTSGASPTRADFYDLLSLGGAEANIVMPRAAKSMIIRGSAVLLIDDEGATWVDFSAGVTVELPLPSGLPSFADIAGGRTVEGSNNSAYVVGATRDAASGWVMELDVAGNTFARPLSVERAGASAVWVESHGLVVVGGSDQEPGVEILAPDASAFSGLAFPPDPTIGAGAVTAGGTQVALIGGEDGGTGAATRMIDLGCAAECSATMLSDATPPDPFLKVDAFAVPGGAAIAVGQTSDGEMVSYLLELATETLIALPLREKRYGARVTPSPNGTLAIVGGEDADGVGVTSVEMFFPE